MEIVKLVSVDSTNHWLKSRLKTEDFDDGFVVVSDFQSSGKGQGANHWESAAGKNLLFSLLLRPKKLPASKQFVISQIVSIAICRTLESYFNNVKIKWPNDIYVGDKKIGGILIENSWMGSMVVDSIIGIGLNVNQEKFISDAPNPVSMKMILHKSINRSIVLKKLLAQISILFSSDDEIIPLEYFERLYRREGYFRYCDQDGEFEAQIAGIKADGQIELETRSGHRKSYYFKEVEFIIPYSL